MNVDIPTLLVQTATSGLIFFAIAKWIADKAVKHTMNRDLATFKSELDTEMEAFKSSLQLQQMKYSLFHAKRVEKAAEIYAHATHAIQEIGCLQGFSMVLSDSWLEFNRSSDKTKNDIQRHIDNVIKCNEKVLNLSTKYQQCYLAYSLYFDSDVFDVFNKFHTKLYATWAAAAFLLEEQKEFDIEVLKTNLKPIETAYKDLGEKLRTLL